MYNYDNIYKGKTVLITGHTGFKGSWLSVWLNELGAKIIGYSLPPKEVINNYSLCNIKNKIVDIYGDIRDYNKLNAVFKKYKPDIVFHLAAQPLVIYSYNYPIETYETNINGTINLLECIRHCESTKASVIITSDKCYKNVNKKNSYSETDSLGGYDPYSTSKACCELIIDSWRNSYFNHQNKLVASVRAGNVIGGGDWSKDRIIPDCINSLEKNEDVKIRSPYSIRAWVHVIEVLHGYLHIGNKLLKEDQKFSDAWNLGPEESEAYTVWDLASRLVKVYGYGNLCCVNINNELYESNLMLVNISKAKKELGWNPKWNIQQRIFFTVDWYKRYKHENVYDLCVSQINKYLESL